MMRYTYEDLPMGKLYVDGVYVPKGIWFDSATGEYEAYAENALGGLIYDEESRVAMKVRGKGKVFCFVPFNGSEAMHWMAGSIETLPIDPAMFSVVSVYGRRYGHFAPVFDTQVALEHARREPPPEPDAVVRAEK